jgi:hypothetical protein
MSNDTVRLETELKVYKNTILVNSILRMGIFVTIVTFMMSAMIPFGVWWFVGAISSIYFIVTARRDWEIFITIGSIIKTITQLNSLDNHN